MQENKVKDTILVFHGTKHENVDKIVQGGFDERPSIRCAWGKGICAAASIEDATEYSKPKVTEEGLVQCVIVAQLAFGPVAVGTRGQTYYGMKKDGTRVTNLKDTTGKYCCSRAVQLVPHYVIQFIWNIENFKSFPWENASLHNQVYLKHAEWATLIEEIKTWKEDMYSRALTNDGAGAVDALKEKYEILFATADWPTLKSFFF